MTQAFEYWPGDCQPGEEGACKHCGQPLPPGARRNCPRMLQPPGPGLGDWIARLLASVGLTKARYQRLRGKPCGCQKRQERLNRWGQRWRMAWIERRQAWRRRDRASDGMNQT